MTWRAYLTDTMSGDIGPQIPITGPGSWTIQLNGVESWTIPSVVADPITGWDLRRVERRWWMPWQASLVVTSDVTGAELPILFGPLIDDVAPVPGSSAISYACRGMRHMLTRRTALDRDYPPGQEGALRASSLTYRGLSRGDIAVDLVRRAQLKPNGRLPIIATPTGEQSTSGANADRDRTYPGFDLANNDVDQLLTNLTETSGGPDIMLRPRWTDTVPPRVESEMVCGRESAPHLPQSDWVAQWDHTIATPSISGLEHATDASGMVTRVYVTGDGQGDGLALKIVDSAELIAAGMPCLEAVASYPSVITPEVLESHGRSMIAIGREPIDQINLTVDGSDPSAPMGLWRVGDRCRITTREWLTIEDGDHDLLIIAASGDFASSKIKIELQRGAL